MTRMIRCVATLAVVLAISAQAAQAAAPGGHGQWKGQDLGPTTHRSGLVPGGPARRPSTVVRVVHSGGSGFDWTAAFVGAASALGVIFVAGAATSVRHRRRVAIS